MAESGNTENSHTENIHTENSHTENSLLYRTFVDRRVTAQCTNETRIEGICRSMDGYLNMVLEEARIVGSPDTDSPLTVSTCLVNGSSVKHVQLL